MSGLVLIIAVAFFAGFSRSGPPLSTHIERGEISTINAVLITVLILAASTLSITGSVIPDWFGQIGLAILAGGLGGEVRARAAATRAPKKENHETEPVHR